MSARRSSRWPLGLRSTAAIIALLALFALLRGLSSLQAAPVPAGFYTDKVVLVGVTDLYELGAADRMIISDHADSTQAAAISVRPRELAECAAAGWTTIGAGRRAGVDGLCSPAVTGSGDNAQVADWQQRRDAAASRGGDAQLGTLASLGTGCIQSVGPGAALAAAHPDGQLDNYLTYQDFERGKYRLDCPLTIVDGPDHEKLVTELLQRQDVTVIVTGVGTDPTASVPNPRALQVIYRIGTTFPGLLTSASTRREGLVTITDLSRTLATFVHDGEALPTTAPLDGSQLAVEPSTISPQRVDDHLRSVANLSEVAPVGYAVGTVLGVGLAAGVVIFLLRRQWSVVQVLLAGLSTLSAALMLTGAFPWWAEDRPAAALIFALLFWLVAGTVLTLILTAALKLPLPIAAAGLTLAAFSIDAALGGMMQPGSLLNSKPTAGLRWYGFGNVTFGMFASAGLVVAGYLAHRFIRAGRRWAPSIAVLAVGALVIACQGWPSMGADFGGVITLTPTVLFLALAVSGLRITWPRILLIGAAAVLAVGIVSVLDWTRGPGRRSHLGDFVERVFNGDAGAIVLRKAVAALDSFITPYGIIGLILGVAVWLVILRTVRYAIPADLCTTYTPTAIAALATAIIGTLLNDAGIAVFMTVTGPFLVSTAGLLFYRYRSYGWPAMINGAAYADRPTVIRPGTR
jgi:hypothetical protein